jgi:hypothetical protein
VNDDSQRQRQKVEAQVERWSAEAKKLADAGKESAALQLYRQAADELPGAPWLQHRTAELAKKLKQHDVAVTYFRRSATAFQLAEFPKRAVAPLRAAWTLAIEGLPSTSRALIDVALELVQLHKRLGFAADASVTIERTNVALRARGFSELPMHVEPTPPSSRKPRSSQRPTEAPASSVTPRLDSSDKAEPTRGQLFSRAFGLRGR